MPRYDAFLLVSFGGPEGPDDVMPFLENVTRGRGVPRARLEQVAEHYDRFGGVSPINQQCRDLLAAIEKDFAGGGIGLPIYWGNRNWEPLLADTMAAMAADGVRHAIAFVTSAYSSYSSCRQYLEDIGQARARTGPGAPHVDKLRQYFNHPGFIEPFADAVRGAVESLPDSVQEEFDLVFTAHSIPETMAAASGPHGGAYSAQLAEACLKGDWEKGRELQFKLVPLIHSLFIETNPIPVKTALSLMGKCSGDLRLPLTPMAEGNLKRLTQAMTEFGLL